MSTRATDAPESNIELTTNNNCKEKRVLERGPNSASQGSCHFQKSIVRKDEKRFSIVKFYYKWKFFKLAFSQETLSRINSGWQWYAW